MTLAKRKEQIFFENDIARDRLNQYLAEGDCYPFCVVLHPSKLCNHKCDFCSYFYNLESLGTQTERSSPFLNPKYIGGLLAELWECGVKSVVVSGGGEPLLHPNITHILEVAVQQGFQVSLYTNLDRRLSSELLNVLSKLHEINVNVNTIREDLYKATRGNNADLSQVEHNISTLLSLQARLGVVVIVRKNTLQTVDETIGWCEGLGVRQVKISPAFDLDYQDGIIMEPEITEHMEKKSSIHKSSARFLEPVPQAVRNSSGDVFCNISYFDITIGADYGVYPCCMTSYLPDYQIINLKNYRTFREAWNSEERKSRLGSMSYGCGTCWFSSANRVLMKSSTKD